MERRQLAIKSPPHVVSILGRLPTTNFHETGARRASAISCAFWLMLAERILWTVWAKLFLRPVVPPSRGAQRTLLSLLIWPRPTPFVWAVLPLPFVTPLDCQRGADG
jgi:hypothetical protein